MAVRVNKQNPGWLVVLVLAVIVVVAVYQANQPKPPAAPPGTYLFCFWNVENLFDDQDDHRGGADQSYDAWFSQHPEALRAKLDHLSTALLKLNDGRGPDILAVAELEGKRAAELLRDALNERLADASLHYQHVLVKDLSAGRHIAPAILTRLPVEADRTRLIGRRQRILEGHVTVAGHDLVVLATHWTSRVSDEEGDARTRYGEAVYGRFREMWEANPAVDLLVCGDFNDTPADDSVRKGLRAIADRLQVLEARPEPLLLNLFGDKDPNSFGTHNYRGKWFIFDQIVVSPGLLDDAGWSCDVGSVATVNTLTADKKGRPWRFGNPSDDDSDRGWSDHFPVTVQLKVKP